MLGWVGSGWVVLACVGLVSKEGGCTWVVVDSSSEESMEVSHPSKELNQTETRPALRMRAAVQAHPAGKKARPGM